MIGNVSRSGLTEARRKLIIGMLELGRSKREIANAIGVTERTIWRWLKKDPSLQEAANERLEANYYRAIERLDQIALAQVRPTAETQFKALMRIVSRWEEKQKREAGEPTMEGVKIVIMEFCKVLTDLPEAKSALLKVYAEATGSSLPDLSD